MLETLVNVQLLRLFEWKSWTKPKKVPAGHTGCKTISREDYIQCRTLRDYTLDPAKRGWYSPHCMVTCRCSPQLIQISAKEICKRRNRLKTEAVSKINLASCESIDRIPTSQQPRWYVGCKRYPDLLGVKGCVGGLLSQYSNLSA